MNQWGERFRISIFGESHGAGIGIVIDGIPSRTKLDLVSDETPCPREKYAVYTAAGGR